MQWFVEKVYAKPDDKNSPMIDLVKDAEIAQTLAARQLRAAFNSPAKSSAMKGNGASMRQARCCSRFDLCAFEPA